MNPKIVLIAAMAANGVIGRAGKMPWHLASDLKRFRADTIGKPVVMGRKTHESIGRPLPGRTNFVISSNPEIRADGCVISGSVDEALELSFTQARSDGVQEVCVIGGGEVYRQTIDRAKLLRITHILEDVEGDVRFPEISPEHWRLRTSKLFPSGVDDSHATKYAIYERCDAI